MKVKVVAIAISSALIMAGCSSNDRTQALGDFEYTNAEPIQPLAPAPDLTLPVPAEQYQIPPVDVSAGAVGGVMNITAPEQVRPIAAGARVEESETLARVYFDEVEAIENVESTVWNALVSSLAKNDIAVAEQTQTKRILTAPIRTEVELEPEEEGWLSWGDELGVTLETEAQYEIVQTTEPHGRTTSLLVSATSFSQAIDGESVNYGTDLLKRNGEVELLNDVIRELLRSQQQFVRDAMAAAVVPELGFNADGEPALTVVTDFETAWALTEETMESLGFSLDDLDKSLGEYYFEYEAGGFSLFGSGANANLDLPEGDYLLQLMDIDDQVTITISFAGKVLDAEALAKFYTVFGPEFERLSQE